MAIPERVATYKKTLDENIKTYIELRSSSWYDVMRMPYSFFIDDLKWKMDVEEKRKKELESNTTKNDRAHKTISKRMR